MANNNFGLALGFLVILLLWIYQRVRMPKMRSLAGYMSRRAIENEETWRFAQRFYSMFGIEIFSILLIGAIIGGLFKIPLLQSHRLSGWFDHAKRCNWAWTETPVPKISATLVLYNWPSPRMV